MAMVGGVLAAYFISDAIISLGSIVGFLTILGVAARNGIMLISTIAAEDEEGEPFGLNLVIRGARTHCANHDDCLDSRAGTCAAGLGR